MKLQQLETKAAALTVDALAIPGGFRCFLDCSTGEEQQCLEQLLRLPHHEGEPGCAQQQADQPGLILQGRKFLQQTSRFIQPPEQGQQHNGHHSQTNLDSQPPCIAL